MRTFDWALFELYNDGHISYEEAIRNADSANELRLNIKLRSERGEPASAAAMSLSLDHMPTPEEEAAAKKEEELIERKSWRNNWSTNANLKLRNWPRRNRRSSRRLSLAITSRTSSCAEIVYAFCATRSISADTP